MGYRKAARLRRTQYVSGHYRTSKNGKTYYVSGHVRNDHGESPPWVAPALLWFFLVGPIIALNASGGNAFSAWVIYFLPVLLWLLGTALIAWATYWKKNH